MKTTFEILISLSLVVLTSVIPGLCSDESRYPRMINQNGHIATEGITGSVSPGKSNTHELLIDKAARVDICCQASEGNPLIKLLDPQGNVVDTAPQHDDYEVHYMSERVSGGPSMSCYGLEASHPTGIWTLEISADRSEKNNIEYTFYLQYKEPELRINTSIDKEYAKAGEPVIITTVIGRKKNPVVGATVKALIIEGMEIIDSLTLYDDGSHEDAAADDGIYANTYEIPRDGGFYSVRTEALIGGDMPFEIIDGVGFVAAVNESRIEGSMTEKAVDSDNDGLYDELILSAGYNIAKEDFYELQARLYDRENKMIQNARVNSVLSPGYQTVQFSFDGSQLYNHGIDGPYNVESLTLSDTTEYGILLDYKEDVYTTKAYCYRDFQHRAIASTGDYSFETIDIDSDGLYDSLIFVFEVDLVNDDSYHWQAQLHDSDYKPIDFCKGDGFLKAGAARIRFSFDGAKIRKSGIDGPYLIIGTNVYNDKGDVIRNIGDIKTPDFSYREFEVRG